MPKFNKARATAYLALLINAAIWALAVPISKKGFSSSNLSPTLFLFARFFLASILSLPIIFLSTQNRKDFKKIINSPKFLLVALIEFFGCVVGLGLLYWGVSLTASVDASVISITYPIFVAIGGAIFLKEKEKRVEVFGLFLAIVGTLLLTISPLLKRDWDGNLHGNILVFLQNIVIASYYLLAKKYYKNINKWVVTHISFWVGTLGFGSILLYQGHSPIQQLLSLTHPTSYWMLLPVIYMATLGSIIALTFYFWGQDKIEASRAAFFTYLHPLFSLPASVILLHEKVSFLDLFALGIIFLGVYLAEKR